MKETNKGRQKKEREEERFLKKIKFSCNWHKIHVKYSLRHCFQMKEIVQSDQTCNLEIRQLQVKMKNHKIKTKLKYRNH